MTMSAPITTTNLFLARGREANQREEQEQEEEEEAARAELSERRRKFTGKVIRYICVQLLLGAVIIAYWIGGTYMFQYMEQGNELDRCNKAAADLIPIQNSTLSNIIQIAATNLSPYDQQYATAEFTKELRRFRDNVLSLGFDGRNCSMMGQPGGVAFQWGFMGSLLFSATVFTTIGYGNIAPVTFWGRLSCITYAFMGIPLMLICLSNIGDVTGRMFRFAYTNICLLQCFKRRRRVVETEEEEEGHGDGVHDLLESWKQKLRGHGTIHHVAVVDDEEEEEDDDDDDGSVNAPLTVIMIVMAFYLFLGALLFSQWAGWSWEASYYYCFVTLSTIGFGDLVPGYNASMLTDPSEQLEMVGACIYILFGMSLISMCFNLAQEEIVDKGNWLWDFLCPTPEEEDDDEDEEEGDLREVKTGGMSLQAIRRSIQYLTSPLSDPSFGTASHMKNRRPSPVYPPGENQSIPLVDMEKRAIGGGRSGLGGGGGGEVGRGGVGAVGGARGSGGGRYGAMEGILGQMSLMDEKRLGAPGYRQQDEGGVRGAPQGPGTRNGNPFTRVPSMRQSAAGFR